MISGNYLKTLKVLYIKAIRNLFSKNKGCHYNKFFIVGIARSGTTLLHTYLNNHPNIFSHGEISILNLQDEWIKDTIFPPYSKNIQAVGAKVLLPIDNKAQGVKFLKDIDNSGLSIYFLFLYRNNLLKWYVSLKIAQKTAQWSKTNERQTLPLHLKQVEIDTKELIQNLKQAQESIDYYRKLFSRQRIIELTYEQLQQYPHSKLNEIQAFLGVNSAPLVSLLKKQNPELLSELIINFEEVKEVLNGTPYQKFLAESI